MTGWLIVNSFVNSEKFNTLYDYLKNASNFYGIDLEIKTTDSILCDVESNFADFKFPDFVIFWDKDIYLARRLEEAGIKVFNNSKAIEICDNKILTTLSLNGKVKIPKTVIAPKTFEGVNYNNKKFLHNAINILKLPIVIKEAYGSFGQQVYLAKNFEEAELIVNKLGYKDFLMQEFIKNSEGKDIRVNVVGNKVVSAMLRYNENDFRSNISNGGKMKNILLTKQQEEIAIKACKEIGLDFAGVDILFGENDTPIVCEVNSNPQFKSSLDCTGIDMGMKIMEYIVGRLK